MHRELPQSRALLRRVDLGRMSYARALEAQLMHHAEVLAAREAGAPEPGRLLLVEHDPVITVTHRPEAQTHLLATPELLASQGVELARTDRGGDITYHGPGQLVAYPIIDLNVFRLGLHEYMRLLEQSVIDTLSRFGIEGRRDPEATGVWIDPPRGGPSEKIGAMGVRVRRWISMHGLALNVDPNMGHFGLIVPCGLAGRPVTSLRRVLEDRGLECPPMPLVADELASSLDAGLRARLAQA